MNLAYLLLCCVLINGNENYVMDTLPYNVQAPFECGNEMGFYCADCNSMRFCSGKIPEVYQVSCRDIDPTTPYCDPRNHVCSSLDMCVGMSSDFWCPDRGTYPDVTDCKRYILCTGPNRTGTYYACLNDKTYDPTSKSCVTNDTCVSYKDGLCKNSHQILSHSDRTMFVQCMGAARPILRCCKGLFYVFNNSTMKCEFECQAQGNFIDFYNKRNFFHCDLINNHWVKVVLTCPPGQIYVQTNFNDGHCDYLDLIENLEQHNTTEIPDSVNNTISVSTVSSKYELFSTELRNTLHKAQNITINELPTTLSSNQINVTIVDLIEGSNNISLSHEEFKDTSSSEESNEYTEFNTSE